MRTNDVCKVPYCGSHGQFRDQYVFIRAAITLRRRIANRKLVLEYETGKAHKVEVKEERGTYPSVLGPSAAGEFLRMEAEYLETPEPSVLTEAERVRAGRIQKVNNDLAEVSSQWPNDPLST